MSFDKVFPRVLCACVVLGLSAAPSFAQTAADITRPRAATTVTVAPDGKPTLENEPVIVALAAPAPEAVNNKTPLSNPATPTLRQSLLMQTLLAAIEERIGTPYRMGATGPFRYDCSGFVWSVFQQAGIEFERGNARSLWTRFEPAQEEEKYKFGTLVFFNNLNHVGIVADEYGFYHASSSKGVVYSRFGDYWSPRIVGFRRIPLPRAEFVAAGR